MEIRPSGRYRIARNLKTLLIYLKNARNAQWFSSVSSTSAEFEAALTSLLGESSLRRYAARIVESEVDADDVLQTVALKTLGREATVEHAAHYVQRSVRNTALDLRRAAAVRLQYEERANCLSLGGDASADVSMAFEKLHEALATLPVLTSQIFQLHYFDGVAQAEIARQFGVHLSSIEKRLAKARRCCMAALEPD